MMKRPCVRKLPLIFAGRIFCISLVVIHCLSLRADDRQEAANASRHVVFLTQKGKDQANELLAEQLRKKSGFKCTVLVATKQNEEVPKSALHVFPGIELLRDADLLVMDIRRKALPKEQLDLIREYLSSGRPFVGFRQASHAFDVGEVPEGGAVWPTFDIEVLGCDYRGHGRKGTKVTIEPKNSEHPILRGVAAEPWVSESPIYAEGTEEKDAVVLWWGHQNDRTEAIAWTRLYQEKGRVFYTSLGVPENIEQPQFRRMAINGMLWALDESITQ